MIHQVPSTPTSLILTTENDRAASHVTVTMLLLALKTATYKSGTLPAPRYYLTLLLTLATSFHFLYNSDIIMGRVYYTLCFKKKFTPRTFMITL